jgi:hypothetical protein
MEVPPWVVAVFRPVEQFMCYLFIAEVGVALFDYCFFQSLLIQKLLDFLFNLQWSHTAFQAA